MTSSPTPSTARPSARPPAARPPPLRRGIAPLLRGLALGAAVGAVFGLVAALIEARWMQGDDGAAPDLLALYLIDAGLLPLLTILVGAVFGLVLAILYPTGPPTLGGLFERLRRAGTGRLAETAAFVPLTALGAFAWATTCAHLARVMLSLELSATAVGVAITVSSLTLGALVALLVLALTPWLRTQLARLSCRSPLCVHPGATLVAALLLIVLLVTFGALSGGVSGEGGWLGIYGILRRQELDLRAPALLAGLLTVVYLAPAKLAFVRGYQAVFVALLPLALTVRAAAQLNQRPDIALRVERLAPLGRHPLKRLRQLSDGDNDGASSYFGGGDCDDRDPAIGPAADDIPDNGIDEDCSGTDLTLSGAASAAPRPQSSADLNLDGKLPNHNNVVLITVDTLRYDLGFNGNPRQLSPALDKLAANSTVFERAYSLASYTGKSVGPMLIGKYGSETHRNWGHFNKFSKEDTFVAQRLQAAGVYTISVQGHRYFGEFGGLARGFDQLDLSAAPPKEAKWATDTRVTSDKLTAAAIRQLDARPADKRFFLWVHYLDPHADYKSHDGIKTFGSSARDMYDHEVAFTDKHIARLLAHLGELGLTKNTSIIVTSDHGEAFGEHNMWRHGFELWEVLVRVPLIVHVPGAAPNRIHARRSLIDLAPTILDLMGLPVPNNSDNNFLSGQSLLPDVFAGKGAARDILVDMPAGPYNEARRAFIHNDLKLVLLRKGNKKQLFDLAADPDEKKDVWRTRKGEIEAPYAIFKKRLREIKVTGKKR